MELVRPKIQENLFFYLKGNPLNNICIGAVTYWKFFGYLGIGFFIVIFLSIVIINKLYSYYSN